MSRVQIYMKLSLDLSVYTLQIYWYLIFLFCVIDGLVVTYFLQWFLTSVIDCCNWKIIFTQIIVSLIVFY